MKNAYEIRDDVTAIFIYRQGNIVEALISTSDFKKVSKFTGTWFVSKHDYVWGFLPRNKQTRKSIYLHRLIMESPMYLVVDHINHDKLDNRRENLRLVTNSENMQNRSGINSNNVSGHRGVFWNTKHEKWQAQFRLDGKQTYLGLFDTEEEAAKAAAEARKLNMPYSLEGSK